jgi:hypothetical protein
MRNYADANRRWLIRIVTKNAARIALIDGSYSCDGEAGQQSLQ